MRNPKKLKEIPTKVTPRIKSKIITVSYPKNQVKIKQLTIDDIDSFSKISGTKSQKFEPLAENIMKKGVKSIIGEEGEFKDWGGEIDDLFTTRVVYKDKRHAVAIGFKGRATKGILTPVKMGKNGDQIQRLFRAPADIFLIQYHSQIAESVIEQMKQFAIAKSYAEGRIICFGVIDGADTSRIIQAYPKYFFDSRFWINPTTT